MHFILAFALTFNGLFGAPTALNKPPKQHRKIKVEATAYTAQCKGCIGITKTGVNLLKNPDKKVIAVDPNFIPLGSKVYIPGYGVATAADTGGAINGNHVDLYMRYTESALNWGKKYLDITILKKG